MERSTDEAVGHPPEGAAAIEAVPRTAPHPRKRKRMAARTANENGQRVVLDFGWWDFMNEEERRSLKSQIKDAYGATLSAKKPLRLVLCSMSEPVFAALATIGGFESWSCDKLSATLDQVALDSGRYVVLSPDAEDVLTSFEEGTTYIVNALVDHKPLPGASAAAAKTRSLPTARLAIPELVEPWRGPLLAINHVVRVLQSLADGQPMQEALLSSIPRSRAPKPPAAPT